VLVPGTPSLAPNPPVQTTPKPPREGPLRFSLAGMQWKLSVREQDRRLTLPVRGETGGWIAKFPSPTYKDLPRVELATMTWAKLSGVDIPPIRLSQASDIENLPEGIPVGDGTLYLIERFDRQPDGTRVHIEDFGQVLDRSADPVQIYKARYEHIAAFVAYLPPEDLRAFCERLVFCILCGNTDAHVKNWSIVYPDGRRPRLAPAYDLVATILYEPIESADLALSLADSKRFTDISLESFKPLAVVTHRSFDEVSRWVGQMVERVITVWQEKAAELPYLPDERARLEAHRARIPLAQGR
jgi:serine/threonine-protein kinase HipA